MHTRSRLLVAFVAAAVCSLAFAEPTTQPRVTTFGDPMKLPAASALDAKTVLAHPEKYDGQHIRVKGTITRVCEKMGCWLEMGSDGAKLPVFIKFTCPMEGRLIPLEAKNKPGEIEGVLSITEMDEDEARHYAEDAGMAEAEIEKIVGPQKRITMKGPSAVVYLD